MDGPPFISKCPLVPSFVLGAGPCLQWLLCRAFSLPVFWFVVEPCTCVRRPSCGFWLYLYRGAIHASEYTCGAHGKSQTPSLTAVIRSSALPRLLKETNLWSSRNVPYRITLRCTRVGIPSSFSKVYYDPPCLLGPKSGKVPKSCALLEVLS